MIRTPLRPLAHVLPARARQEDPDSVMRHNLRQRHDQMEIAARQMAESRLLVLIVFIVAAFAAVAVRMANLAHSDGQEPTQQIAAAAIAQSRADITDRHGRILATNFETHSLYAQPPDMVDPAAAARGLVQVFPDLDEARLLRDFTGKRKFIWIKRRISPEQMQAVHDIGDPGLRFGPREMRLYPNGSVASHVLGGASFGKEGVNAAEVLGVAGVEKHFDAFLRDPAQNGRPLQLSLDLTVQAATEEVLAGGMAVMNAEGASAVVMDIHTGEVVAIASLPDFDPNDRPRPALGDDPSISPLFNRAVQGVYELGSVFKIFTAAQAMDLGLAAPETEIDTTGPLRWGRFKINDFRHYGNRMSVTKIIEKSSNIGTARLAQQIGAVRQKNFLESLGLFDPTPLELTEAGGSDPLIQKNWSELTTMTVSYGHGISVSPMHLAAGYAAIANGGRMIRPTLLKQSGPQEGVRVLSERAAAEARMMLRRVVSEGTASMVNVKGYSVAGKTGTADKPRARGGYYEDKVLSSFAGLFPAHDPAYAIVVTLDEPEIMGLGELRRTAGWTAVPVTGELIRRIAPLLGVRPLIEPDERIAITQASN
ncbi:MAG: penicillin-binding protein 2 [Rhodobacteraceae bacterium]|nr:penicillin-binding protein 2 [Paracoccaceae bacterium]